MPWCPVCKYEYKEGFKLCADCGAELVDVLEQNDEPSESSCENNALTETNCEIPEIAETDLAEAINPDEVMEMIKPKIPKIEKAKPFVKASDRAENYKSSAYALLLVGILGIVFLILAYTGVISFALAPNINFLFYGVMGIMFLVFIIMGFKSFVAAKVIAAGSKDEEELTERIYSFFEDSYSTEKIDLIALNSELDLSEEEKFFPRSQAIRNIIIENFGELDEAYLTELTETAYSKLFE